MEDKTFVIPKLKGFKKDSNDKIVPVISRRSSERIQYPQVISNLVNYDGYHLILSTERKPFTVLTAFTSGMGLAYIDDNLKLCEPSVSKTGMNSKMILHPETVDMTDF